MTELAKTDARLLAEYSSGGAGAAAAFERLVAAHGGMVHQVCLRILGRADLAEDAAQATFLVLARKAGSVRGDAAAFLQGVAVNVALRARESELARRAREKEAAMAAMQRSGGGSAADWERIRPHLDEAVAELPAGERAAVTLHYLEGRPHAEVAERLAVPEGTVASRLNRAVARMREFFRKREVELSAEALGPAILAGAGGGCPAYLLAASGSIAAAGLAGSVGAAAIGANVSVLAKGALKAMFWIKVKVAAAVVVAAATVGTAVPVTVAAGRAAEEAKMPEPVAQVPAAPATEPADGSLSFRRLAPPRSPAYLRSDAVCIVARNKTEFDAGILRTWRIPSVKPGTPDLGWPKPDEWVASLAVDFDKEMVLAAFKGRCTNGFKTYAIERVAVPERGEAVVRVDIKYVPVPTTVMTDPLDLVACPRRDLPVVFFENGKEVARVPFKAEEVLEFRRLDVAKFVSGNLHIEAQDPAHRVLRSAIEMRSLPVAPLALVENKGAQEDWYKSLLAGLDREVDFGKEMVLAAFKGLCSTECHLQVQKVTIVNDQVRVDLKFTQTRSEAESHPFDLVACPRRDLPVVFFENGKEVARVPFKAEEDKELAGFLEHVRYSSSVWTAKVAASQIKPGREGLDGPQPSWYEDLAFVPGSLQALYAPKLFAAPAPEVLTALQEMGKGGGFTCHGAGAELPAPKVVAGDSVIFSLKGRDVFIRWSPDREKAVRFALAPGWDWARARCPWHSAPGVQDQATQEALRPCESCGRRVASASHPACTSCKMLRGECHFSGCTRKVGPATRGVEARLLFCPANVNRKITEADSRRTIKAGEELKAWVSVYTHGKQAPEFMCPGGKGLEYCSSVVFLVSPQGRDEFTVVHHAGEQGNPRARMMAPAPLSQDGFAELTLLHDFKQPGTYTVRAAAGRLVSNPVTVVVGESAASKTPTEDESAQEEAKRRAQLEAERLEKEKAVQAPAAGPQPRWQPGGNAVDAVDAASGKLIWSMNPGFAVGNVVVAGGQWKVTSQDGRQMVTVDAATGKTLMRDNLAPAKHADSPEPF